MVAEIRQALYQSGISLSLVHEIVALVETKPLRVQRAFLLRVQGKTQGEMVSIMEVPRTTMRRFLSRDCADIRELIRSKCVLDGHSACL